MELKDRFCDRPWSFFEIQEKDIYNCCPTWVNHVTIGKTTTDLDIDKIWNGESAKQFRQSILDGSFRFCNKELCPRIKNGSLPTKQEVKDGKLGNVMSAILEYGLVEADKPTVINLCYDRSCNLRCPSCRKDFIYYNEKLHKEKYDNLTLINDAVLKYVQSGHKDIELNITGSGDPFGSKNFFDFLKSLNYGRNRELKLTLQTNGVLFDERRWEELSNIHKYKNIKVIVSLDAGDEEAYSKTRVGGDWKRVNENLYFIKELQNRGNVGWVRLDMVVQNNNFRSIPKFIDIAREHDFESYTSRIVNWGTFTPIEFVQHDIFDHQHPSHNELKEVIKNTPEYDKHDWGNISELV